jgi:NAD-dependent dihydropyrimidine dehydrogenase PreA subunit/flavodoxin
MCSVGTQIYYFSGTGNSLHVARELQKRIPGTELVPILNLIDSRSIVANPGSVGFVFPHYASTLPKVVRAFIQKLDPEPANYLFAIVTRGGTKTMAFVEIDEMLREKGQRLDAHFAITMPSGSDPLVKGYAKRMAEARIRKLESEMLSRLDSIQNIIISRSTSREEDWGDILPPKLLVPFMPLIRAATPFLVRLGKLVETTFDFYQDETCTGCGLCETVCLSEKVRMVDGRPAWQEKIRCHGCFACLNYCPEESIQVKSRWFLKSYTEQNGRYHHPAITAWDIRRQKTKATS